MYCFFHFPPSLDLWISFLRLTLDEKYDLYLTSLSFTSLPGSQAFLNSTRTGLTLVSKQAAVAWHFSEVRVNKLQSTFGGGPQTSFVWLHGIKYTAFDF